MKIQNMLFFGFLFIWQDFIRASNNYKFLSDYRIVQLSHYDEQIQEQLMDLVDDDPEINKYTLFDDRESMREELASIDFDGNGLCDHPFLIAQASAGNEVYGFLRGFTNNSSALLADLAVGVNHRNKGIAQRLFTEFEEISKKDECKSIRVHVLKDNDNAIAWYVKNGFVTNKKTNTTLSMEKSYPLADDLD